MEIKIKDKRLILVILSSFAWGILAHGMAMFNKYSYHDDVPWFNGVGETYGLGRWFLAISGKITELLMCSRNYSTPVFNGMLTIAGIAVMTYLMCKKLKIESNLLIIALCGVMISFPAVTNIFGYVFTAPYYYLGALLAVAGAYVYYTYKNIPSFIFCSLCMALSTGLYQSNIAIHLMALLLFMLEEVYESDYDRKEYIILAMKNALMCACFMAEYLVINRIVLNINNMEMYDYKGVNSFGMTGITGYLHRVVLAYKRFIKPADHINYNGVSANMFPWNLKYLHMLLVLLVIVLLVLMARSVTDRKKQLQIALLVAVSPLFSYFIYVMVAEDDAHGGMGFGQAFMFFLAAFFIERAKDSDKKIIKSVLVPVCVGVMMIMGLMFARFANVCYLKAEVMQAEAINYYNTLITRIKMTEGYTEDTPVVYIAGRKKNDDALGGNRLFDPIYLPPYQGNSIINDFAWEETMRLWCGFSPVRAGEDAADSAVVDSMSVYPDDGSIKMADGVLIVKFAKASAD